MQQTCESLSGRIRHPKKSDGLGAEGGQIRGVPRRQLGLSWPQRIQAVEPAPRLVRPAQSLPAHHQDHLVEALALTHALETSFQMADCFPVPTDPVQG
jgi:hypothetical protein